MKKKNAKTKHTSTRQGRQHLARCVCRVLLCAFLSLSVAALKAPAALAASGIDWLQKRQQQSQRRSTNSSTRVATAERYRRNARGNVYWRTTMVPINFVGGLCLGTHKKCKLRGGNTQTQCGSGCGIKGSSLFTTERRSTHTHTNERASGLQNPKNKDRNVEGGEHDDVCVVVEKQQGSAKPSDSNYVLKNKPQAQQRHKNRPARARALSTSARARGGPPPGGGFVVVRRVDRWQGVWCWVLDVCVRGAWPAGWRAQCTLHWHALAHATSAGVCFFGKCW